MNLRKIATITIAAVSIAATSSAFAAKKNGNTGFNVKIQLLQPLSVINTADLDFGEHDANTAMAAHTISYGGTTAKFTVTGATGRVITISVQNASTTMSNGGTGSANQVVASNFKIYNPVGADITGAGTHTLAAGNNAIEVGGQVDVLAEDNPGSYTGTNTLLVAYQ